MFMDNQVIDATSFAKHHPGGASSIVSAKSKDITVDIKAHFPLAENLAHSMLIGYVGKERERLLDPAKPLAHQIWGLSQEKYREVVNSPHWFFVPSPRLFESEFFERLSYSTWWHVAVLPAIIIYCLFTRQQDWDGFSWVEGLLLAAFGVLCFTLTEYLLHRFIFHAEWYLPDIRIVRMLHFFLHGIHHMLPNDPYHLPYLGADWCYPRRSPS
jgi:hypothetical protein